MHYTLGSHACMMPTTLLLYLQKSLWLQVQQYNILKTTRTNAATSTNKAMKLKHFKT